MAELNTGDGGGGKDKKVRSKKQNSKVDLTAMVDYILYANDHFV
jgi:hypothetical protein